MFCLAFEELDMFLIDDLKKGVLDRGRNIFAHDEHVQAASLRPRPDIVRGKVFISPCVLAVFIGRKSVDVKPFPKSADDGKTLIRPMIRRSFSFKLARPNHQNHPNIVAHKITLPAQLLKFEAQMSQV